MRTQLNRLLACRLPAVKLLSDGVSTMSKLAKRWADESGIPIERFAFDHLHPIREAKAQCLEWMFERNPSGLIVFYADTQDGRNLRRRAAVMQVPVRVVDMRLIIGGPGPPKSR